MADPIAITANQVGTSNVWATAPYYPPVYSGGTYQNQFTITLIPSPTTLWPDRTQVNASDDSGVDQGGGMPVPPPANPLKTNVTVTKPGGGNLGTNLNLTIVLTYGTRDPE